MADFIGRGFAYPLQLDGAGKFKIVGMNDKIKASLAAILGTPRGSRIMLRDFGCRIHELNFSNPEEVVVSLARFYTQEAIETWEPRVELDDDAIDVQFDEEAGVMFIIIRYTIRSSNTEDNFVYPFKIRGAA